MKRTVFWAMVIVVYCVAAGCSYLGDAPDTEPKRENRNLQGSEDAGDAVGIIKIINNHKRATGEFPGCRTLPIAREKGICFLEYNPDNELDLNKPPSNRIFAKDEGEITYELPVGTYLIQEWQFDSEVNRDPLYVPCTKTYERPSETIIIEAGETLVFGDERSLENPGDLVEVSAMNSVCSGATSEPTAMSTKNSPDETDENLGDASDTPSPEPRRNDENRGATSEPTAMSTESPSNEADISYVQSFAGKWDSNWGDMSCTVDGIGVSCTYTHDKGRIEAILSEDGKTMVGEWSESPSYQPPRDAGYVKFTLSEDNESFSGTWGYGDNTNDGSWTATRK